MLFLSSAARDFACVLAAIPLMWGGVAYGQSYWSAGLGGSGNDQVRDVKVDADGYVYATGEFSGSITFGGVPRVSAGGIDMFLTKLSPAGDVIWFVQGGGIGIDGGIKLAVRDGHVAVAGTFMQTAEFQGQSLTSAGAQDIFLALHDAATGQLQWIAAGGGPSASDRPYGVSIAASGNVTMAGEFSATVNLAGEAFTSMTDPLTLVPGVDVFIASYGPSGSPLWAKQGTAKYSDRAVDVVNDPTGNIYVTGQFSDTIQFTATYPNTMYNASFLLKLDADGNELWFRRMGGAVYDQVRDMQWTSTGELLLVGDLQGIMMFLDSGPDLIDSVDPYAYYLLRVNPDGELVSDTVVGSANLVSGRAVDERNGTVAVLGEFNCQFTSFADSAHAGLWMATGIQDLFVVRHSLDSLNVIKDAQQYGGPQEKSAGQVASLLDGSTVFCGGFEDMIVFPCTEAFTADIASAFAPYGLWAPNLGGYCNDPYYGSFAADTSNGLKDGFIARGHVPGRSPYDWWDRTGQVCDFQPRGLCLGEDYMPWQCADTVEACGETLLGILPEFSWVPGEHQHFVGPDLDLQWSTGATTDSLPVIATDNYAVTCTSLSGCWQWSDTLFADVHPIPPQPLLSDDVVVATDSPYQYLISICDPTVVQLWCSNVEPGMVPSWSGPGGVTANDSVTADTSGTYYFSLTTEFGCSSYNGVNVSDHPNLPIPPVEVALEISYPQDVDLNDSLSLCPGEYRQVQITTTWTLNGAPYTFPSTFPPTYQFGFVLNGDTFMYNEPQLTRSYVLPATGWYPDSVGIFIINAPCGDDTLSLSASAVNAIHVTLFPSTVVDVEVLGPMVICPGDTGLLVAVCDSCGSISWQGNNIITNLGDSVLVQAGHFTAYGSLTDTNGCSFHDTYSIQVTYPGVPELDVLPPDGIICPDSLAVVFTNAIGQYTWYGPLGEVPENNDSIAVSAPGEYYLALTDPNDCYLISDPILLTGYATPFLNILPDGVLCVGEGPVLLQVVTTGYTSFQWAPPLAGNSLIQSVDQPGIYACTVQACGIVTELQTEILTGSATAQVLDLGPFAICPGDTVTLVATDGSSIHYWQPGPVFGDSLLVTQSGSYTLVATDPNGCADSAEAVVVAVHDLGPPLTVADFTGCAGDAVVLTETAPGALAWYADAAQTVLLSTGPVLDLGTPTDSTVVYLVRSDSVCTAPPLAVAVNMIYPSAVILPAPGPFCGGASLLLEASGPTGWEAVWTVPAGMFTGTSVAIDPLTPADEGWYVVMPTLEGCPGVPDSVYVAVHVPMVPELAADTTVCIGGETVLVLPAGFTDAVWSTGNEGNSLAVQEAGTYNVSATDTNGCAMSWSITVVAIECPPVIPNVITPNGDGVNDGFTLWNSAATSGQLQVFNRWGKLVHAGDPTAGAWNATFDLNGEPVPDGVYYYLLRLVGREGKILEVNGHLTVKR
jgi:gliding motility-associated-like protein